MVMRVIRVTRIIKIIRIIRIIRVIRVIRKVGLLYHLMVLLGSFIIFSSFFVVFFIIFLGLFYLTVIRFEGCFGSIVPRALLTRLSRKTYCFLDL